MDIRNRIYNFTVEPKSIGKQIKTFRKSKGITAEKLAEVMRCSVKTVSSWERGARIPSIDNLVDLANFFEVSVHSLVLPYDNCEEERFVDESIEDIAVYFREFPCFCKEDKEIAHMLKREEYLLQRFNAGVFNKHDEREYYLIVLNLFGEYFNLNTMRTVGENGSKEYFEILKEMENKRSKIHFLLNRLSHGEELLTETVDALNGFDRDCIFTVSVYFKELREKGYSKNMYDAGARFIDCDFADNAQLLLEAFKREPENNQIIDNLHYGRWPIFSESDVDKYLRLPDDCDEIEKAYRYSLKNFPRYTEDPAFYNGRELLFKYVEEETDPIIRRQLNNYYLLLRFVRYRYAKTYEDYEQRRIDEIENLSYDEYIRLIIEKGALVE